MQNSIFYVNYCEKLEQNLPYLLIAPRMLLGGNVHTCIMFFLGMPRLWRAMSIQTWAKNSVISTEGT